MKTDLVEGENGLLKLVETVENYKISLARGPEQSVWKNIFDFVINEDYRVQRFVYN